MNMVQSMEFFNFYYSLRTLEQGNWSYTMANTHETPAHANILLLHMQNAHYLHVHKKKSYNINLFKNYRKHLNRYN